MKVTSGLRQVPGSQNNPCHKNDTNLPHIIPDKAKGHSDRAFLTARNAEHYLIHTSF